MKNYILLFPLLIALAACGVSSSDGVVSRGANKSGFMGMSTTDAVVVDGEKTLAGINEVVIGSFNVAFNDSSIQKKQAKGLFGGGGFGGKAAGKVRLEGVDNTARQAITDAAYRDFTDELKSKGFNVLSRSTLTSSDQYGKIKKATYPFEDDDSPMFSAYGKSTVFQPSSFGSKGIDLTGGFVNMGSNDLVKYAKENNVAVIDANYLIDFAAAGGHESMSSASVQVGQSLAVTQATVKFHKDYTSTFSNGAPTLTLGQPVEATESFGQIQDETSAAMNVTQETINVISALAGGGTSRTKNYTVVADPAKYKKLSVNILERTNSTLLSKSK